MSEILLFPLDILSWWNFLIPRFFLSQPVLYGIICIGLLTVALWALLRERVGRWQRNALFSGMITVLLFIFWPYQPAVKPASGHAMILVTKPLLFMNGLSWAQAFGERVPCQYEILGWHADSLYYRSQCMQQIDTIWYFIPQQMARSQIYQDKLPLLEVSTTQPRDIYELVGAATTYPDIHGAMGRYFISAMGYPSPDNKWIAATSKYQNGREDVILLSP